ncbi:MAG: alpha-L-rhamnosidase N-terminal domain-containing protein, partial [Bacteroidota bacterium]
MHLPLRPFLRCFLVLVSLQLCPPRLSAQEGPASFIWTDEKQPSRFAASELRYKLPLDAPPKSAILHLFADSRYQLYVNGAYINFGPSRFYPAHPRYDSYDLTPYLSPGVNEVLVRVVSNGTFSFQLRRSRPGFIAWGEVLPATGQAFSLATPGDWECRPLHGLDSEALHMSFALGPMEVYDARQDSTPNWQQPVQLQGILPWGPLQPRNIPPLTRDTHAPQRLIGHYTLSDAEDRWFFRVKVPDASRAEFANGQVIFGQ